MLVLVGSEPLIGMGRIEVAGEVQHHPLRREARRSPELGQALPAPGAVTGLLLELAPGSEAGVLDLARGRIDVERSGRDLKKDAIGRRAPLANEQDVAGRIDRDDGDRAGVARDVALGATAVGPLDRVNPELEVAAAVQDARRDDPLDELLVLGSDGIGRGRRVRRRARGFGRVRAGGAGPSTVIGQAATASRSEIRLAPDSASNRCSFE